MQSNVYIGIKPALNNLAGNSNNIDIYTEKNNFTHSYDYVLLPITNSRYKETVKKYLNDFKESQDKNSYSDFIIPEPQLQDISISPFNSGSQEESIRYIGLLSSWLELESSDLLQRSMAYQVLSNECKYAKYVGIKKLILAPPKDLVNLQDYSQVVARLLNSDIFKPEKTVSQPNADRMILSISLPLCEDSDPLATWELWNTVRKLCDYHPSLAISLAVSRAKTQNYVINRWLCEPVSCLLVSSSIFAKNQYGYPVLHKFNQNLIRKFQDINGNSQIASNDLCILLHGMEKYAGHVKGGESSYLAYMNYLLKKGDQAILSEHIEGFNQPQLLSPLKPHSENLSNEIYTTFEKDEVKYSMYEKAIEKAIIDLRYNITKSSQLVILIAGAGRGAIVDRLYQVVTKNNIINKVKILALEKNPEACLYLQKRNFEYWDNNVELIKENMRDWKDPKVKIDLCISELLGSFGCNELSPECLFEVERYHGKPSTVYIPQSYSSYMAPITCPLIYQKLKDTHDTGNVSESLWVSHKIPYQILSSKINKLWTFNHPMNKNNFNKNITTVFKMKHRGEVHGLVGFFTATLYDDDTILSIIPNGYAIKNDEKYPTNNTENLYHTPNMFSWSPMVFPLSKPLPLVDDTELSVLISRFHDFNRVWYEWSLESSMYFVVSSDKTSNITQENTPFKDTTTVKQNSVSKPKSKYVDHEEDPTFNDVSNPNFSNQKESQPNSLLKKNFINLTTESERDDGNNNNNNNTSLLPSFDNGWESVNDIHDWVTKDPFSEHEHGFNGDANDRNPTPMFNLSEKDTQILPHGQFLSSPPQRAPAVILPRDNNLETEHEDYITQDIHIRVKTGATHIHNISGSAFSIAL
ncbi:protein arginine N-methyltransferase Hsl7p [Monosporozyma servazzii]